MLRIFSNRLSLGRKYAKNERHLYSISTQPFTNIDRPILPFPQRFPCQKHVVCGSIGMPLAYNSMFVRVQGAVF